MAKKASKIARVQAWPDQGKRANGPWSRPVVFDPKVNVPDVNPEFALRPAKATLSKPVCFRKPKKGETASKGLRECHVELVFNQGTFLRLCTGEKQRSPLVPVANHAEATQLANRFCACRKTGDSPAACATKIAPGAPLGRLRGRGRR